MRIGCIRRLGSFWVVEAVGWRDCARMEGGIMDTDFAEMLATRILYQLERQGLIKTQGATVDEVQASIRQARVIAAEMIRNGAGVAARQRGKKCASELH